MLLGLLADALGSLVAQRRLPRLGSYPARPTRARLCRAGHARLLVQAVRATEPTVISAQSFNFTPSSPRPAARRATAGTPRRSFPAARQPQGKRSTSREQPIS